MRAITTLVLLALVVCGGLLYAEHERSSYLDAKLVAVSLSLDSARAVTAKADTILIRDTVRFAVHRTRYDSIRVTDTVVVDSVVYVSREMADSTIRSCSDALGSCGQLVFAERNEKNRLQEKLNLTEAMLASQKRRTLWQSIGSGLIGYGACSILK